MRRTDTHTLIAALRILARDIESDDGVANECISEGADRLEELFEIAYRQHVQLQKITESVSPAPIRGI